MKKLAGMFSAVAALAAYESDALACGGCFAPPETPTVVTDHHMIYSVSSTQATLYDQIVYTGAPSSFAWILPYRGDVTKGDVVVGVSSDVVFRTVDSLTQTTILPPPRNCPPYPASCPELPQASATAGKSAEDSNGVDVLKQEVVGPYETAHLAAESAADLEKWLTDHGYALTDATKQVIGAYIGAGQQFHFLALKLVPGKDVQSMKPVRITTKGSGFDLPLRMIAAGSGATVGITLWVIAEGRYQAANFDMFTIGAADLAWDWTNNKSNYIDVRTAKNAAAQGKAWELESATAVSRQSITQTITQGGPFSRFGGGPQPFPVTDAGTNSAGYDPDGQKTADEVRDEDYATLFAGIAAGAEHITRLRADLDHTALDRDLHLQATTDQSEVATARNVVNELNEPLCPVYVNCESTTSAPRSQATATITKDPAKGGPAPSSDDDDGCATSSRRDLSTWLAAGLGAVGFVLARKRRRR